MTSADSSFSPAPVAGSGQLRGTVLLPDRAGRVAVLPDGVVRWQAGRITAVEPAPPGPAPAQLLVPGFVDLHCHWPQAHVRGAFSGQLLPWLQDSIWPAEAAFADPEVARARAERFLHEAIAAGTCAALLFGPPYLAASLVFDALAPRGFFDGPALMEVHAPDALLQPVAATLAELALLPAPVRARRVVSPRFAPNLTAPGLAAAGRAATALGLPAQSHLSENRDEVAWVRALFPEALDYTDVYDRAGLLGPHVVLAHGIHLSDRELARLAATGTVVAHCPTSNEALGSGRMPLERLRAHGVSWVLATDVGAGPRLSQLDTIRACLEVQAGHADVTAAEALCRSTAIPGAFLARFDAGLQDLGTFAPGAPAHVVALPRPPGPAEVEALLRGVIASDPNALERLPARVVVWGEDRRP